MIRKIAMLCGALVLGLTISLAAMAGDDTKATPEKKGVGVTAEKMLADGKCACKDCKCVKDGKCTCTDKSKCECCKKCTMEKCKGDKKDAKCCGTCGGDKKDAKTDKKDAAK